VGKPVGQLGAEPCWTGSSILPRLHHLKLASLGPPATAPPALVCAAFAATRPLRLRARLKLASLGPPATAPPALVCSAFAATRPLRLRARLKLAALRPPATAPPALVCAAFAAWRPLRLRARLELAARGPRATPRPRSSAASGRPGGGFVSALAPLSDQHCAPARGLARSDRRWRAATDRPPSPPPRISRGQSRRVCSGQPRDAGGEP